MKGRGPGKPGKRLRNADEDGTPSPRDLQVYARLCEGKTLRATGEEFGLSYESIRRIGNSIDAWLTPQLYQEIRSIKARQTGSLQHIYCEAMDAWEKSKRDSLKFTTGTNAAGAVDQTVREQRVGDPQYLNAAMKALEQIRNIWGADSKLGPNSDLDVRSVGDFEAGREAYAEKQIRRYQEMIQRRDAPSGN